MRVSAKEQQQEILAAHRAAKYLMDHRYRHDPKLFKSITTIKTALASGLTFDDFGRGKKFQLTKKGFEIVLSEIKDKSWQIGCRLFINTGDKLPQPPKICRKSDYKSLIKKKRLFFLHAVHHKIVSWNKIKQANTQTLHQAVKYLIDNQRRPDLELFPKIRIIEMALDHNPDGENQIIGREILENLVLTVANEIKNNVRKIISFSVSHQFSDEVEEQFIRLATEHELITRQDRDIAYELALNQNEKRSLKAFNPAGNPFLRSQLREVDMETSFALSF